MNHRVVTDPEYLMFDLNITVVDGDNLVDVDCHIHKKAENVMVSESQIPRSLLETFLHFATALNPSFSTRR